MKNNALQLLAHQYQQIIKNPQNYDAVFQLGLIHYQSEQYQQALPHFISAYHKNYKTSLSSQYIGNIYYHTQQYQTAIYWYQASLEAQPNNDSPYNSLGVIYKKLGKIQESISYFQKCLKINSKNSLAHYAMGNIYYDLKDFEKALEHYDESIASNPKYDAPYIGRGNVLKKEGRYDEASKEYLKSLYLNPKNQAALSNLRNLPTKIQNDVDLKLNQLPKSNQSKSQLSKSFILDRQNTSNAKGQQAPRKIKSIIRRSTFFQNNHNLEQQSAAACERAQIREQFKNAISEMTKSFKALLGQQGQKKKVMNEPIKSKNQSLLSARDKDLLIQIDLSNKQNFLKTVEGWIQRVINQVVSTSFNFYLNNQMTYNQARIYCCQKILTNIYLFISKQHQQVNPSFMNKINKFMEQSLEYIKYKYPLNEELQVPYKLQHFISSNKKDNTDSIQYDYFSHYPYEYEYRQSGIYNDIIMRMINNLISTTNTNYYSFKETMTKLFQNVFDPNWKKEQPLEQKKRKNSIDKSRNQSPQNSRSPEPIKSSNHLHKLVSEPQIANTSVPMVSPSVFNMHKSYEMHNSEMAVSQHLPQQQTFLEKRKEQHQANRKKREHREKVQSYTSYVIKRKIPEFVKCYSDEEIRNINVLKIKDKSIFRILTKWCQQLWQKFDLSGYFLNKINVLMLKDKKLFYLSLNHKEELDKLIEQEKKQIKKFIEKISKDCNMKMQYHLLTRWLLYEDQLENNTGIFSTNVVESLQYFTVSYLNRLIHGLLKVSKKFSCRVLDETHPLLLLLTFRIKDLLRCRFKSKEQQSEKVLRHILEETEMTVLRVKNRLNDNNNDIMINLFFEKMICEIQLAVQTNTSKFIECSNNFNHFLYELERSYFGPITEMSNIWQCHDKRMKHYKKIEEKRIQAFKIKTNNCSHFFQKFSDSQPFICSNCNRIYYHYNYIISHKVCIHCKLINCGNCQLACMPSEMLKKHLKIDFIHRYVNASQQFPKLSYFLLKECTSELLGVYYIKYVKRSKKYLISIKNNDNRYSFDLVTELTEKTIKGLLKKYVIVQIAHNYEEILFKNQIQQALFAEYIKESLSEQKDELSLCDFLIGDQELKMILKQEVRANEAVLNHCKVKKLIIDRINQGKIRKENLDNIVSDFSHLKYLWIANNQLDHLPKLNDPAKMIMINLQKTDLKELQKHGQFEQLSSLQFLIINNSHLKEIPCSLKHITTLVHLEICNSNIKHLHDAIFNHLGSTLVYLNLSSNHLEKLPESIKDLQKLEHLNVSDNSILSFPNAVAYNIALTFLNLSQNILRVIPESFENLVNLEYLDVSSCSLANISSEFSRFSKLKKVNLSSNKLHNVNFLLKSKISKQIILSHSCQENHVQISSASNRLTQISNCEKVVLNSLALGETLSKLRFVNIKELTINQCRLTVFPNICRSHQLRLLDLCCNLIEQIFEEDFEGLHELQELILNDNPLRELPGNFEQLEKLKILQLENCGLRVVPAFKKANKLTTLKIGYNYLTELPDAFFNTLPDLRILDVSNNINEGQNILAKQGEERQSSAFLIGDKIGLLNKLQQLYLGNSQLAQIPKIASCSQLTVLRLEQNIITHISKDFEKLQKLRVLRLDQNSFSQMKHIQILGISCQILPSMTILKDLLAHYSADPEDKEEQNSLSTFAIRFSNEINSEIAMREQQVIKKYGENMIEDTSLVPTFLRIESQYYVVKHFINKIDSFMAEKIFNQRHLNSMRDNLMKRIAQIENEEFNVLKRTKLMIANYSVCFKEHCFSSKFMGRYEQHEERGNDAFLHRFIRDASDFQAILKKMSSARPIVLDSLKQLVDISISNGIHLDVTIRYYPYLEEIIMPMDVKEAKVVANEDEVPIHQKFKIFNQKYTFYRFNTNKFRSEIIEQAYFISSAQTKLISSKIKQPIIE